MIEMIEHCMIDHDLIVSITSSSHVHSLTVAPRFLLVSLNITAILGEATVYDRREQLRRMTKDGGLGDAYSVTWKELRHKAEARQDSRWRFKCGYLDQSDQ